VVAVGAAKLSVSLAEAGEKIGVCKSTVIALANEGRLETFRIGRRRLVPVESLERFVRSGGGANR
jgi:excisionase family DNA binding protein